MYICNIVAFEMNNTNKSDYLGILISSSCLIHCIATPFIFVAQTCTRACCAETPLWWRTIDYVFLAVSFAAIWFSTRGNTKNWLKAILWINWGALSLVLLFEELAIELFFERVVLVPAITLIGFHLFNKFYRTKQQKETDSCSASCCS